MGTISNSTLGLRAQEIHEGLRDVSAFGPKEAYLRATLLTGKVASLATHLKGLNYVDDLQALTYLAAELGISGIELTYVLNELQEVDFATVIKSGTTTKRIELRIPELRDSYENLGKRWFQLAPTEIERASITLLDNVATFPRDEVAIKKWLGLDDAGYGHVMAIGEAGALIDRYTMPTGETVLYSPLTVEEKPDAILELSRRYSGNRIIATMNDVRAQQGVPVEFVKSTQREIVLEGVMSGVLCPVQIASGGQEHTFLFTPHGGLQPEERVILEKARAILACVRCGEHFAQTRKILYPKRILETLRDRKRFAYPRPDFPEQYGLLVTKQIGFMEEDKGRLGFYNFFLYDTPENMHALDIAIDLLEYGQTPTSKLEVDAREFLGVSGSFSGTLPTRTRLNRRAVRSREMARDIIGEISKLARGIVK